MLTLEDNISDDGIDTNSIVKDEYCFLKISSKRCPKRPRRNVCNDAYCAFYQQTGAEDRRCIFEERIPRVDGFTYCGR